MATDMRSQVRGVVAERCCARRSGAVGITADPKGSRCQLFRVSKYRKGTLGPPGPGVGALLRPGLPSHQQGCGLVLLIVMHESGTWRVRPGQVMTFGRSAGCTITLPADRGVSRSAG